MEDQEVKQQAMLEEVLMGMHSEPKSLPSKYFYDERGSKLFDQITRLDEYYPTRTEQMILKENVNEIENFLGEQVVLIEPGSGSSEKTRILLDAMNTIKVYIPIDISAEYLNKVAEELRKYYPDIHVKPLSTDYTQPFQLPEYSSSGRKIVFFPGSTIGNFEPETVRRFLGVVSQIIGKDGGFLIGVDLKKDADVLEAAYNDSRGVTAAFNKNMLRHINREVDAEFRPDLMEHQAIWKDEESRIEMRLYAKQAHVVRLNGYTFTIEKGEYIHTENSHKYSLEEFEELVRPWFKVCKVWTDERNYFSLQYLEPN